MGLLILAVTQYAGNGRERSAKTYTSNFQGLCIGHVCVTAGCDKTHSRDNHTTDADFVD
jgi:hypothetical protein